jgi:hypothetical protein
MHIHICSPAYYTVTPHRKRTPIWTPLYYPHRCSSAKQIPLFTFTFIVAILYFSLADEKVAEWRLLFDIKMKFASGMTQQRSAAIDGLFLQTEVQNLNLKTKAECRKNVLPLADEYAILVYLYRHR